MKKKDVGLFLLAFFLALVGWLRVGEPTLTKTFSVPLTIETREGYAAIYPPAITSVEVTGSPASMDRLREQDLRAVVNLTGFEEGTHNAEIVVTGPKNLDLTYTPKPQQVARISLEREDRKTMPVEFKRPGSVGLSAATVPPKVLVRGPRSLVEQVGRAVIAYDLTKEAAEQPTKWKVDVLDREGKLMTNLAVEPDTVEVDASMVSLGPRSLVISPTIFGQPAPGHKFLGTVVKPAVVKAQVPPGMASTLSSLSTAPVHIENAQADVSVSVQIILPDGVRLVGPGEVEVTVKVAPDPAAPTPANPGSVKKG